MKIRKQVTTFQTLKPGDTFRPVYTESNSPDSHSVGNLYMVVRDSPIYKYKGYDLQENALISFKNNAEVVRVRTELVILQENL